MQPLGRVVESVRTEDGYRAGGMRRGRIASCLRGVALPLAVCAGLFVMHGLDGPGGHGSHAAHGHGTVAEAGAAVAGYGEAHDDEHRCPDCLGAVHVAVVCMAVLVTVVVARSRTRLRLAAVVRAVTDGTRACTARVLTARTRPAWMRLAVMLC
jgi:hypothetical protein